MGTLWFENSTESKNQIISKFDPIDYTADSLDTDKPDHAGLLF